MSEEPSQEKKDKMNLYANACAQIGETVLAIEIGTADLPALKEKARQLLLEIKGMK